MHHTISAPIPRLLIGYANIPSLTSRSVFMNISVKLIAVNLKLRWPWRNHRDPISLSREVGVFMNPRLGKGVPNVYESGFSD